MDDEGIGIVLAKATELRSKINTCINNPPSTPKSPKINGGASEEPDPDEEEGQEAESLLNIRDALESLESQLASLQELQQQQRYEREAALSEIDYSRKMLLNKLKEYKGKDLEVIHEASAFAGESVEHSNDLLLPPYPTRPPRPLILENGYAPPFTLDKSAARNGVLSNGLTHEAKKHDTDSNPGSRNSFRGIKFLFSSAAKMVLTVVGVVSILTMAGFEPMMISRRGSHSKFLTFFALPAPENLEHRAITQCPPGKMLLMENGEAHCIVKERIEIPFESVSITPDVTYGCGHRGADAGYEVYRNVFRNVDKLRESRLTNLDLDAEIFNSLMLGYCQEFETE